jgi:hypothetical protein
MWRGKENLGIDKEPHHMDIKNGTSLDPQRMSHPTTFQDLAAPTAQGSTLDPGHLVWWRTQGVWTLSTRVL